MGGQLLQNDRVFPESSAQFRDLRMRSPNHCHCLFQSILHLLHSCSTRRVVVVPHVWVIDLERKPGLPLRQWHIVLFWLIKSAASLPSSPGALPSPTHKEIL